MWHIIHDGGESITVIDGVSEDDVAGREYTFRRVPGELWEVLMYCDWERWKWVGTSKTQIGAAVCATLIAEALRLCHAGVEDIPEHWEDTGYEDSSSLIPKADMKDIYAIGHHVKGKERFRMPRWLAKEVMDYHAGEWKRDAEPRSDVFGVPDVSYGDAVAALPDDVAESARSGIFLLQLDGYPEWSATFHARDEYHGVVVAAITMEAFKFLSPEGEWFTDRYDRYVDGYSDPVPTYKLLPDGETLCVENAWTPWGHIVRQYAAEQMKRDRAHP